MSSTSADRDLTVRPNASGPGSLERAEGHLARPWWRPALTAAWAVSALLILASLAAPVVLGLEPGDRDSQVRVFFDVTGERNLPAWWNSGLFLTAAVLSLGVAALRPRAHRGARLSWLLISALTAALSLDELVGLHERLPGLYDRLFGENPLENYAWLMLGVPLALVVCVLVIWAVRSLDRQSRLLLLAGFVVFFAGAIGVEALTGALLPTVGMDSWSYVLLYHLEEALEFFGAAMIAVAPLASVRLTAEEGSADQRLHWLR